MAELHCKKLVELVTDYLEEALSPEERARFEAHLADCGYCTLYVDQMRKTVKLVGTLEQPELAPALRGELLDLFRSWRQGRP